MQLETNAITFRPGQSEDLPLVKELTKDVWGGHDYMPYVWNEWLAQPNNRIYVLEVNGVVAGFFSLELLSSRNGKYGWWQGVRVATPFRRQSLAAKMLEYTIAESRRLGLTRLRYATGEPNTAMHRLGERYGFRYLAPYTFLVGSRLEKAESAPAGVRPLEPNEFELAWNFIQASVKRQTANTELLLRQLVLIGEPDTQPSPNQPSSEAIHCDYWTWKDLEPETVQEFLKLGQVYGYFEGNQLEALALLRFQREDDNNWSFVTWLDGSQKGMAQVARYLHLEANREASPKQENVIDLMLVRDDTRDQFLQEQGFKLYPDDRMRLYELSL